MSGLDKKNKITNTFTSTNYNLTQCNFLPSAAAGCFSVIPEIFHEEYNQTFSDSDRTVRDYVRFTQIILNTFCMLKQEEIHSCKEL